MQGHNIARRIGRRWQSLVLAFVLLFVSGTLSCPLAPITFQTNAQSAEASAGQGFRVSEYDESDIVRSGESAETTLEAPWPMAAANPQRTSWTSEEVRGTLRPVWYRVIEPYIAPHIQIIAANGLLYISTAGGLYALDAATGATAWVYPTKFPLGNAPTIYNGVAYVGGYDRRLHALDAITGEFRWAYEAQAGFATNPLVLDIDGRTIVYVGNRDGHLYAVEDLGNTPTLFWQYLTDGPILFSAAYAESTVYIASNDSHAYALDARTGGLVWKSPKLSGAGFHVWWPVIYQNQTTGTDVVILAGSNNYRMGLEPDYGLDLQWRETADIFPDRAIEPRGTLFGPRNPDGTVQAERVLEYFEAKPWRRTYIVLSRQTGYEVTFDFDGDGNPEYAPILWHGTHSGNRYPPIIAADSVLYQSNTYMSDEWIPAGQVSGWVFGSSSISTPSALWIAMDEPMAYSAGGNLIYWSHCMDRSAGAFDISLPNTHFFPSGPDSRREWIYFNYNLASIVPGYSTMYDPGLVFQSLAASPNGVYGQHGNQNPPIPYGGRVYLHRSNAVIAFGATTNEPVQLPMAGSVEAQEVYLGIGAYHLRATLAAEVGKILAAGHLRPGYFSSGGFDHATRYLLGDHLIDYWHDPSDTLYTLILTLPYLPSDLQQSVRAYLEAFYEAYPPRVYTHVGWSDGLPREPFDLPQEVQADLINHPAWVSGYGYSGWTWPPQMFYALWKYAAEFGDAKTIFDVSRSRLELPPSDAFLVEYPYVHNAYIAGYLGYLELEALAGYPESTNIKAELSRLLALRSATFDKNTPYTGGNYARALSIARNFMFLVPELGQYLHDRIYDTVREAIDEYEAVAPYWFVSKFEATVLEGANQHFYDYHALLQAKAMILQEPGSELAKYLDVPAVQVGDLFYIQNLVAVLDAGLASGLHKTGTARVVEAGEVLTYSLSFSGYEGLLTVTDTLPVGVSAPVILPPEGTSIEPIYDGDVHRIVWQADLLGDEEVILRYRVTVDGIYPTVLKNWAELSGPDGVSSTASFTVIANAHRCYFPLVLRSR